MYSFDEHVDDLQGHISRVQHNAKMLALKLADQGQTEFARVLLANAHVHDASKWHGIEWEVLHQGPDVDKALLKKAIEQHQKTNPHHPEYWGGLAKMPVIYIAEMVCDWLARSQEMGSSLSDWVTKVAPEKFHFEQAKEQVEAIHWLIGLLLPQKFAKGV